MTKQRLKILHVVRQFHPSKGGLETYVNELASRQSATCDVTVLTLNRVFGKSSRLPAFESAETMTVIRVPFIGGRRLFLPFIRPALLRGYDVVHIHGADQLLDVIAMMSEFMPMRLHMTTHGLYFHTEVLANVKKAYLRAITKRSLGRTRAIFAVSSNDASILESVGVHATVLRNPIVPLGDFICEGEDLLYVGRLSANKRIGALISFMAHLVGERPTSALHIVGADQENLWPSLVAQIKEKSLQENILYHGYRDMDELASIAMKCGFTVSASRYEGFGLSVIEGMSVGLVPFMHCNAAFQETFDRSGCGLLTDFDDPAQAARDFAAWCGRVTRDDRERAARFGHAQSWDTVLDTYEQHYLRD